MTVATYRRYDPRLKNLVAESNDITRFLTLGIPKSTLRQWVKDGVKTYISIPELDVPVSNLIQENLLLKNRLACLEAERSLVTKTIRIFGFQIQYLRLPSKESKAGIIGAIKEATKIISVTTALDAIGLSMARYFHWMKRQAHCSLQDESSCPRLSPTRITSKEIRTIRDLYTSRDYTHFSMTSLSLLAKKTGQMFASVATWSRVVKELDLKRVRHRVYPDSPKIGIRASKPFEIWHLDLSVIRLRDGSKAFIQAVIDNYSRYVLAWNVSRDYGAIRTRELLVAAIKKAKSMDCDLIPNVFVDSGSENLNGYVDELVQDKLIERTVAQIDVIYSNSMIEMLFQRLKHRHLYNVPLIDLDALDRETNFYLTDANNIIPLAVLGGAMPFEALSGTWSAVRQSGLQESAQIARDQRRLANLARRRKPCLA